MYRSWIGKMCYNDPMRISISCGRYLSGAILALVTFQTILLAAFAVSMFGEREILLGAVGVAAMDDGQLRSLFGALFHTYRAEKLGFVQPETLLAIRDGQPVVERAEIRNALLEERGMAGMQIVDPAKGAADAPEQHALLASALRGSATPEILSFLFDEQELIKWYTLRLLAGEDGEAVFVYDPAQARFHVIPTVRGFREVTGVSVPGHPILRAVHDDAPLRGRAEKYAWSYVNDISRMRDDGAKAQEIADQIVRAFGESALGQFLAWFHRDEFAKFPRILQANFSVLQRLLPGAFSSPEDGGTEKFRSELLELATADRETFLQRFPFFHRFGDDAVRLSGAYRLSEDVIVPKTVRLIVAPGTRLRFDPGVSLLSFASVEMKGDEGNPITLEAAGEEPWGSFAVLNAGGQSALQWVRVSGGRNAHILGAAFPGMVAFHGSPVVIADSAFMDARGENALSLRDVYVDIQRTRFERNAGNGVIVDRGSTGSIGHSTFAAHGGSAVVLRHAPVVLEDIRIDVAGGNCIDIGLQSTPLIGESSLRGCQRGILITDDSHAIAENVIFEKNDVAIEAAVRTDHYAPSSFALSGGTFLGNGEKVRAQGEAVVTGVE